MGKDLSVMLMTEGSLWVAVLLDHFIAGQGDTPAEALEALSMQMMAMDQLDGVAAVQPAPEKYWSMARAALTAHPERREGT